MANTYKRLGAAAGNGTIGTAATLYTCPAATAAVVSSITVCNASATPYTYTIAVHTATSYAAGAYVVYQATIGANDTVTLTQGLTLDATNKYLLVSSSNAAVNFQVFGVEIS